MCLNLRSILGLKESWWRQGLVVYLCGIYPMVWPNLVHVYLGSATLPSYRSISWWCTYCIFGGAPYLVYLGGIYINRVPPYLVYLDGVHIIWWCPLPCVSWWCTCIYFGGAILPNISWWCPLPCTSWWCTYFLVVRPYPIYLSGVHIFWWYTLPCIFWWSGCPLNPDLGGSACT